MPRTSSSTRRTSKLLEVTESGREAEALDAEAIRGCPAMVLYLEAATEQLTPSETVDPDAGTTITSHGNTATRLPAGTILSADNHSKSKNRLFGRPLTICERIFFLKSFEYSTFLRTQRFTKPFHAGIVSMAETATSARDLRRQLIRCRGLKLFGRPSSPSGSRR